MNSPNSKLQNTFKITYLSLLYLPQDASLQEVRTPTKTPTTARKEGLASPQLAACAPSGANMPLSSSTAREPKVNNALCQRTPTSIESWLARTPGSASPPLRKVLSPCPQPSGPSRASAPLSERRAKRRLDTGEGAAPGGCQGARPCGCVTELYSTAKRSRPPTGACRPAIRGKGADPHEAEPGPEDHAGRAPPTQQPGKENCSAGLGDWLSVMGERLKKGQGSPRSPSRAKRQDGRTPASPVRPGQSSLNKPTVK